MGLSGRRAKQRIGKDPRNLSWADGKVSLAIAPVTSSSSLLPTDASRFGQAYLEKFGWDTSKGLGASGEGRTSAIKATQKLDMLGIGMRHQKDVDGGIAWRQNRDFEDLLRRLNEGPETTNATGPLPADKTHDSDSLEAEMEKATSEDFEKIKDDDDNEDQEGVATKKEKKKKKKKRKATEGEEEDPDRNERKKKRKELSSSKDGDDGLVMPGGTALEPLAPLPPRSLPREAHPAADRSPSAPVGTATATTATATVITAPVPVRAP